MTNPDLIAVWWVNQKDCEQILPSKIGKEYIREEFLSRCGRAGRGRLWVPNCIQCQRVEVPENVVCQNGDTHGGIVIFKEDIDLVWPLGGFVSDANGKVI